VQPCFDRGYFWGYFYFEVGVFFKTEVLDEMALTDTEIKKAKAKEKAYSLERQRRTLPLDYADGRESCGAGHTGLRARKSSCPWASIQMFRWRWPENATPRPVSCWQRR
jgi:hypothetical protein